MVDSPTTSENPRVNIKQIQLADGAHDIDAKYFNGHSWADIKGVSFEICDTAANTPKGITFTPKDSSTAITGTLEATSADQQKFYLVYNPNHIPQTPTDSYDEYVSIGTTGATGNARWELIGRTGSIDLSPYATKAVAGKAGTYTSTAPSSNSTGSAGAGTATGSATITYSKSAAATGSTGSNATANTSEQSAQNVSFDTKTFTGTTATLTHAAHKHSVTANGSISVGSGTANYTPGGSISGSQAIAAHSHSVNAATEAVSITTTPAAKRGVKVTTSSAGTASVGIEGGVASGTTTAVTGIPNFTGGSLGGTRTFNTDAIKDVTLEASTAEEDGPEYIESISYTKQTLTGTTSFNTDAIKSASLDVADSSATGRQAVVVSISGGSASGTFNTNAIKSIDGTKNYGFSGSQSNIMTAPTVSSTGILSWTLATAGTQDAHTGTAANTAAVSYTAPSPTTKYVKIATTAAGTGTVTISDGAVSGTTKYMKRTTTAASKATVTLTPAALGALSTATVVTGVTAAKLTGTTTFVTSAIKSAALAEDTATTPAFSFNTDAINGASSTQVFVKSATLATSGAATIDFTKAQFSGTGVELKFTGSATDTSSTTVGAHTYTPAGTLSLAGTVAAHSHTYVSLPAHTHEITLTPTEVTGTAAVAVSNHTHTLNNHTHNVTIPNCNS